MDKKNRTFVDPSSRVPGYLLLDPYYSREEFAL
jgi:hypothetical protein